MAHTFTNGDQVVICESGQCGKIIDIRWNWAIVEIPDKDKRVVISISNIVKLLDK